MISSLKLSLYVTYKILNMYINVVFIKKVFQNNVKLVFTKLIRSL